MVPNNILDVMKLWATVIGFISAIAGMNPKKYSGKKHKATSFDSICVNLKIIRKQAR